MSVTDVILISLLVNVLVIQSYALFDLYLTKNTKKKKRRQNQKEFSITYDNLLDILKSLDEEEVQNILECLNISNNEEKDEDTENSEDKK